MEAIPVATDDSTERNPTTVKDENENSQNEGGRSSPPPNCAICLGKCRNKSFTDSCLHQFCFKCLVTWSKVKTECPLCKQNFKSIIHNVRSNQQYEEYPVEQPPSSEAVDLSNLVNANRRFRYRTTLTLPRRETVAIQELLLHFPPLSSLIDDVLPARAVPERRSAPYDFRRTVYRHKLWARPLPDFTGRLRNCTPEFFRYNDSQVHRLVPWLQRELDFLLNGNTPHIAYVTTRILELLPQYRIISSEFCDAVRCYFGHRTEHFVHEFYCFASTPYDLTGYDRNVQYHSDSRLSLVNQVLSSSDSEGSRDSDIVVVSSSHPSSRPAPAPVAGPSRLPVATPGPVYPHHYIPQPDVVPIETISHSDNDSDSSVMVVGYIKPPHQRTPEQVDLVASDSDVIVQEEGTTAPALVKLTLAVGGARPAARSRSSDSEHEPPPPPPRPRRRRARNRTPSPQREPSATPPLPTPAPVRHSPRPQHHSPNTLNHSPKSQPHLPTKSHQELPKTSNTSSSDKSNVDSSSTESSSSSDDRWKRSKRRKRTSRSERAPSTRRDSTTPSRDSTTPSREQSDGQGVSVETQTEDKWHKFKSNNGKGVKSSRRLPLTFPSNSLQSAIQFGASANIAAEIRKITEKALRRKTRERKRLRSVVNVINKDKSKSNSNDGRTGRNTSKESSHLSRYSTSSSDLFSDSLDSDWDDNIPLKEALKKSRSKS